MTTDHPWRDGGLLEKMYIEDGLTIGEIADEMDAHYATVWRWMDRHEIPRRLRGSTGNENKYRDSEWLRRRYVHEMKSMKQISEECDCSTSTVKLWLDKHGIETRSKGLGRSVAAGPLSMRTQNTGHEIVMSRYGGEASVLLIHRLCAAAWFGHESVRNKVVHHKNGIPWDNREDNLECMTDSDHRREHLGDTIEPWGGSDG